MNKYQIIKQLGDGSFGTVYLASMNDKNYAIKKMKKKFHNWQECLALREVKSLKKVNNHENIIQLHEVVRENNLLFFVFEYADGNLLQRMKTKINENEQKQYTKEMLKGLQYMHMRGFFHRDLKPENLLLVKNVIKIGDFGLARETRSLPPYTDYVSTRWYRAPEVLLRSVYYSSAIDLWAVGVIIVEMGTRQPLWPGNTEIEQISLISNTIGIPSDNSKPYCGGGYWEEGLKLASMMGFKFIPGVQRDFREIMDNMSTAAVELVCDLLQYDPSKRPNSTQALQYKWLQDRDSIAAVENVFTAESSFYSNPKKSFTLEHTNRRSITKFEPARPAIVSPALDVDFKNNSTHSSIPNLMRSSVDYRPTQIHIQKSDLSNYGSKQFLGNEIGNSKNIIPPIAKNSFDLDREIEILSKLGNSQSHLVDSAVESNTMKTKSQTFLSNSKSSLNQPSRKNSSRMALGNDLASSRYNLQKSEVSPIRTFFNDLFKKNNDTQKNQAIAKNNRNTKLPPINGYQMEVRNRGFDKNSERSKINRLL